MKLSHSTISLLLISGPVWIACSDEAGEQAAAAANEFAESWDKVKTYTIEQSAEFRASVDSGLRELDGRIAEASRRGGEAWEAARADLEAKRAALAAQLDELGAATADGWEAARDKTVALYEEFRDAVERALERTEG